MVLHVYSYKHRKACIFCKFIKHTSSNISYLPSSIYTALPHRELSSHAIAWQFLHSRSEWFQKHTCKSRQLSALRKSKANTGHVSYKGRKQSGSRRRKLIVNELWNSFHLIVSLEGKEGNFKIYLLKTLIINR